MVAGCPAATPPPKTLAGLCVNICWDWACMYNIKATAPSSSAMVCEEEEPAMLSLRASNIL